MTEQAAVPPPEVPAMSAASAPASFGAAETFPHALAFDRWWRGLLPGLLAMFVGVTLLAGCVFGALRVPAGWVFAVLAAAVGVAAWFLVKRQQFLALTVLELSSAGVVASGPWVRTSLSWSSLRRIDPAGAFSTDEVLAGDGERTVGSGAPWYRRWYHGADGRVCLTRFDPQWRRGRIGDWIRTYRPDLLRP